MRERGFYWIIQDLDIGWEIAYWNTKCWNLTLSGHSYQDNNLLEIDEKQIKRNSLIQFEIDILSKYIEHPTKPGYKRSDIVGRIKDLNNQIKRNNI